MAETLIFTNPRQLKSQAEVVLATNDLGDWTRPASSLYPHRWLWDSCFVAIGLSHIDPARAARELQSIALSQWSNGMLPHMVFSRKFPYSLEALLWGTKKLSPPGIRTSGMSQPPVFAIAIERVAASLPAGKRMAFVDQMLPVVLSYHEWIYRERDPGNTGLAAVLHSWESGLDDSPYWTKAMRPLSKVPVRWRWLREFRAVNRKERASAVSVQRMVSLAYTLKTFGWDGPTAIRQSKVVLGDLVFNSVLAAANESLERLAESTGRPLSNELRSHFAPTRQALETLWDHETGQYYSRNLRTGKLIITPTIATFMPLFAGTASPARAAKLRDLLTHGAFKTPYPVPSTPPSSPQFEPDRYWRGPTWIDMNWFIITGLERYGYLEDAARLREQTLGLVEQSGFREYYNPLTGQGLGAHNFSWSAALTINLLAHSTSKNEPDDKK